MNIVTVPPFNAFMMLGLEEGYTDIVIDKNDVIKEIQTFQEQLFQKEKIYLSANVIDCQIVLKGQEEPHLKIEFINYPHANVDILDLKKHVLDMAKQLFTIFKQNRLIISYPDEIVMLENNKNLNPKI